ncbi:MAG: hypothetical protein IJD58_12315 [Lachnospiraceae bacterium]|nr:hypothetical protein [Tyzzerella sp.]MBQ2982881.1 hypothetical protein [Lachnospiraceae bacterium]
MNVASSNLASAIFL